MMGTFIMMMSFMMLYLSLGPKELFLSNSFMIDKFTMILSFISLMTMSLIFFMKFTYSSSMEEVTFLQTFLLLNFCSIFTFMLTDMLMFLTAFEMTIMPTILFMIYFSKDKEKLSSSFFMCIMNMLGSIPFMTSFYNQSMVGSTNSVSMSTSLNLTVVSNKLMEISMMLIMLMKIPMFLVHFWLSKAHVSALGVCSMFLAGTMIKLGGMGLTKYMSFYKTSEKLMKTIFTVSIFGMMVLSMVMSRFVDKKYVIALSSVVHMSLIPVMCMHKMNSGIQGVVMMMSIHGLVSYMLFYMIMGEYESQPSRSTMLSKSLESKDKVMTLIFIMYLMINLGFPPFPSFISEILMLKTALSYSSYSMLYMMPSLMLMMMFTFFFCSLEMTSKKGLKSVNSSSPLNIMILLNFLSLTLVLLMF